jgi:tetraprenyl-beta-curcumene synthase
MRAHSIGSTRAAPLAVFVRAAHGYWTSVFPRVARELGLWRERAHAIPDPLLRAQALEALAKRGNMEGAAAFATFAPPKHRAAAVRAIVAFQTAYNHLDTISEQSGAIGPEQARHLHEPLLAALAGRWPGERRGRRESAASGHDYERHIHPPKNNDGGYLEALVETCREALSELPSYETVAPAARLAAERVVCFQAYNGRDRAAFERWGRSLDGTENSTRDGGELRWWEMAASAGSSLGVHVMIAAAAEPALEQRSVDALERAYSPWIGALHSMLDHLIDAEEDRRGAQHNLIDLYASPEQAAERMRLLAKRALASARSLPLAQRHELIVAAMASFYLSAPEARVGQTAVVARAALNAFGPLAPPPLAIFRARRGFERLLGAIARPDLPGRRRARSGTEHAIGMLDSRI